MGTVLLCVLSSLAFCLCGRFMITAISAPRLASHARVGGYSGTARRIARGYAVMALALLMAFSAFGAVISYIELFSRSEFGF